MTRKNAVILERYILLVCGERDLDNQSSNRVLYPELGANLFLGSKGIKLDESATKFKGFMAGLLRKHSLSILQGLKRRMASTD